MNYFLILALVIAVLGAVKDVRGKTIPNWLSYSGILSALAVRAVSLGWIGLRAGLLGILIGGGFFYVLFVLGGIGGGDVKLMAAVSAWAGTADTVHILLASAISGGILAVFYMALHKKTLRTIRNAGTLLKHHVTSGLKAHPALNIREPETLRIPYGVAIALGTLYCVSATFRWR